MSSFDDLLRTAGQVTWIGRSKGRRDGAAMQQSGLDKVHGLRLPVIRIPLWVSYVGALFGYVYVISAGCESYAVDTAVALDFCNPPRCKSIK